MTCLRSCLRSSQSESSFVTAADGIRLGLSNADVPMPEFKVTFIVVSELEPELIQRTVQTGLQDVLDIERIMVGPPWQKHRQQLRRTQGGALEFRMVDRPVEPDTGGRA